MSELSGEDLAAIQDIHERWLSAELRGDYSQVVELCTDDASWMPPDAPPLNGKEAIAQYLSENTVELEDIVVKDVLIHGAGSIAYLTSCYHTQFRLVSGSEIQEVTGSHIWILRKTENQAWRVAIVSWSYWGST